MADVAMETAARRIAFRAKVEEVNMPPINKPWTDEEIATLRRMAAAGASHVKIAKALGRRQTEVASHAFKMHLLFSGGGFPLRP